jgi:hypothetical protein
VLPRNIAVPLAKLADRLHVQCGGRLATMDSAVLGLGPWILLC